MKLLYIWISSKQQYIIYHTVIKIYTVFTYTKIIHVQFKISNVVPTDNLKLFCIERVFAVKLYFKELILKN